MMDRSGLDFLGNGLTMACLRASRTVSGLRQLVMKETRQGPKVSMKSFTILAWTVSRGQMILRSWTAL